MKKIILDEERKKDVLNIASGAYSPLQGFLRKNDFENVLKSMRLNSDDIWPIPIVLDIDKEKALEIFFDKKVALMDKEKKLLAILNDFEIYEYDKEKFAENVFGTKNMIHPGIGKIYAMERYLVGGELQFIRKKYDKFSEYNLTPQETKKNFRDKGWKSVVGFQTRNIPHRGHEFLQMKALESVDGLFVQPVIGRKKPGDFLDEIIIDSYKLLFENHYPEDKTLLGILPIEMRYAGPREAIFHALIRKNYGCTHFIVGRNHAGVCDFYKPFDAQKIFDQFDKDEIGIEILKFPEVVFDSRENKHCFINECKEDSRIKFSGTNLRDYLTKQEMPPEYILRPEIFNFLINNKKIFID